MGTIREYIAAKLNRFEVNIEDVELDGLLIEGGLDGMLSYDAGQTIPVKTALVKIIPEVLLMPNISEGGYSITRNIEALKIYYSHLCADLGLVNILDQSPSVSDITDLW